MKRSFEYRHVAMNAGEVDVVDELNKMGLIGWELVCVYYFSGPSFPTFYLRRELPY